MTSTYPIIDERPLRAARRHFGLFARRDVSELPETPAGAVLVFEVNGGYKAFTERRHLKGSEEAVVEAVSVAVVDVRGRTVPVEVRIPSRDLGYRFVVRATFRCRVTHPETVVAEHVRDVSVMLADHLRRDVTLMRLGMNRPIEETHALSLDVATRVQAYLEYCPPEIDGVEVALTNVELLLPNDVVVHGQGLKKLQWEGETKELLWAIENKDVARIEAIFKRGVDAVTALGVSRDQVLMTDAISVSREAEEQRMRYLSELIGKLPEGALDFLPVDTYKLINRMLKSVAGVEAFVESGQVESGQVGSGQVGSGQQDERRVLGGGRHARGDDDGPRPIGLEDLDD
ncbi:hypothetical protein HNP84_000298 [Thermocatellispora tengchongensis]|uniref:Band 7 domain-containing protein n=1 Tax=Thermocatellispora tengchongensis TaxID=1073253 RepID=A0A840NZM1_9ACTN|nr:hypothetical protein [Thermocatellispora tengchongensis]MBB5130610.1 hypothetical protein [Thermocatellispora tengchongensis]